MQDLTACIWPQLLTGDVDGGKLFFFRFGFLVVKEERKDRKPRCPLPTKAPQDGISAYLYICVANPNFPPEFPFRPLSDDLKECTLHENKKKRKNSQPMNRLRSKITHNTTRNQTDSTMRTSPSTCKGPMRASRSGWIGETEKTDLRLNWN